ncbi:CHAT domain-containing protein [Lactarius hatsudake]|nr:CHAT domain-containing protein [Lactarius hatsudake]
MAAKLSIADIDYKIACIRNSLLLYPRPNSLYINSKADLDKCIVFLPPVSWAGFSLNVVELLFHLASALLQRAKTFEQPRDTKYSIEYLRYLRGLPLDYFGLPKNVVTTFLIQALVIESEAYDGAQSIEEMMVLCRELLASDLSAGFPVVAFVSLVDAVNAEFLRGGAVHLLDEVIECLRDAVKMGPPSSHLLLFALANALCVRILETHSNDDYGEATALLERVLHHNQSGECPDSIRDLATSFAAVFAYARSTSFQNPEYSEVVRFIQYNLAESLEEANSYTSQVVDLSSSQESGELFLEPSAARVSYSMTRMAEKIRHLEELLSNTHPGTERHKEYLSHLADWCESKFHCTKEISDIEESIKHSQLLVDATHYSSDQQRTIPLCSLHDILLLAFKETSKISYLNESITVGYDILELKSAQHVQFHTIRKLVSCLHTRAQLSGRREDLLEILRPIPLAVDSQYGREPRELLITHLPRLPTRIYLGRFEEAIETLKQGRALLWSEMRGLRAPMAQLTEDDPPLAMRFTEINQELEALTIAIKPSGRPEMKAGVAQGGDGMDPFGRLVVKRQKLVEEPTRVGRILEDAIIHRSSFRRVPWPVILINHCQWRSDILIVFHNFLPCSIPTANNFYHRANELRDGLVEARKRGLDSCEYQDSSSSVLKGLCEPVGEPMIKRLRLLGVPAQSRIWWCPTSVFCFLPLHAMGPIPSSDSCERYFSDLYIPSYTTPSLSAPIESHKVTPQMLGKPSLLLVAQPDDSLPGVKGEIKVIRSLEARVTVADLVSSKATPSSVVEGLRDSHFAHFACHGVLETGKPFEASFKLHGGSRLTLLDIVRSRLPDAEFAFLSCCHAAEITEESIADEALHLTAAMQYCGFRSVVGTMWEMADTDGRDLAKSFYKSLFPNQETDVPSYERSAGALRDATQKLRGKRGITLERWVNFVHYGA